MLESGLDSEQSDARAQTLWGLATHKPRASRSQVDPRWDWLSFQWGTDDLWASNETRTGPEGCERSARGNLSVPLMRDEVLSFKFSPAALWQEKARVWQFTWDLHRYITDKESQARLSHVFSENVPGSSRHILQFSKSVLGDSVKLFLSLHWKCSCLFRENVPGSSRHILLLIRGYKTEKYFYNLVTTYSNQY